MRVLVGLPRRRAARTIHPVVALLISLSLGIVVATGASRVAQADPPPGSYDPWLEVAPTHGRAAAAFTARSKTGRFGSG